MINNTKTDECHILADIEGFDAEGRLHYSIAFIDQRVDITEIHQYVDTFTPIAGAYYVTIGGLHMPRQKAPLVDASTLKLEKPEDEESHEG